MRIRCLQSASESNCRRHSLLPPPKSAFGTRHGRCEERTFFTALHSRSQEIRGSSGAELLKLRTKESGSLAGFASLGTHRPVKLSTTLWLSSSCDCCFHLCWRTAWQRVVTLLSIQHTHNHLEKQQCLPFLFSSARRPCLADSAV